MKIVAEIGNAHEGSLGMALAYIDAVADAGVDAVKFQCHDGDPVSEFRPGTFFPQDATRQDYWRRVGFKYEQWRSLREHAHKRGIKYGVSVFATDILYWLIDNDEMDFVKIPSGLAMDTEFRQLVEQTGLPFVISTGCCGWDETEHLRRSLRENATLLECTSAYPATAEQIDIGHLELWKDDGYFCQYGISDHSGTIWPSIAAATLGADMAEVHVCFSRQQWGPDVSSSITIDELRQLVQGVRFIERMRASTVTKDELAAQLADTRRIFGGA